MWHAIMCLPLVWASWCANAQLPSPPVRGAFPLYSRRSSLISLIFPLKLIRSNLWLFSTLFYSFFPFLYPRLPVDKQKHTCEWNGDPFPPPPSLRNSVYFSCFTEFQADVLTRDESGRGRLPPVFWFPRPRGANQPNRWRCNLKSRQRVIAPVGWCFVLFSSFVLWEKAEGGRHLDARIIVHTSIFSSQNCQLLLERGPSVTHRLCMFMGMSSFRVTTSLKWAVTLLPFQIKRTVEDFFHGNKMYSSPFS